MLLKKQYSRIDGAFKSTKNQKCKMDMQDNVKDKFFFY
jgi:hypothetical protein